MSPEQFKALADQGYNRIPVMREVLADLDTPLSTYLKLAHEPYTYLFESVQGGEKWGRYSIIGLPSNTLLKVVGRTVTIETAGKVMETHEVEDPLAFIETYQQQFRVPELPDLPRFTGGLVGYFGYDIVRYIEKRLDEGARKHSKPDPIGTPDILLMLSDDVVVFDNLRGSLFAVTHVDPATNDAYNSAQARIDQLIEKLKQPTRHPDPGPSRDVSESDFKSGFEQPDFEQSVDAIKDYVLAGDVMQVVISQRMTIPFDGP
ncbi:MAG: anthranilate synthase component I, partial [Ketobacteraceae bacterium]|nr:anthranilate synthase component I [Ketobacteraceae bacterium]